MAPKQRRGYGEPNMLLGSLGAVVAGIIGLLAWYAMVRYANIESGLIAWGVGGLVGFGCRILGGGYSSKLGFIAGSCALIAIVGGQYVAYRSMFDQVIAKQMDTVYAEALEHAQKAVQQKTDEEIRAFLANTRSGDGKTVTPEQITAEDLADFRKNLPELRDLASGKTKKEQYQAQLMQRLHSVDIQGSLLKESLSLWTLLWLFLGIGSAYKLGSGKDAEG